LEGPGEFGALTQQRGNDLGRGGGGGLGPPLQRCFDAADEGWTRRAQPSTQNDRLRIEQVDHVGEHAPEGATRLVEDAIRDLVLKGVEADVIGVPARMGVGDLLAEGVNGDDRFEAAEVAAAAATRPSGSGLLARSTSRASRSP